jgi:hypothetical protein
MWWWSTSPPVYVLIWVVIGNPNPGEQNPHVQTTATHSQEFVGLDACAEARSALIKDVHEGSEAVAKTFANKDNSPDKRTMGRYEYVSGTEVDVKAWCFRKDSPQPRR